MGEGGVWSSGDGAASEAWGRARMLLVPNSQILKGISMFWHHWPFSGTVWNLNPNFDTEIFKFMVKFQRQGRAMGSNANFKKIRSGFDFFGFWKLRNWKLGMNGALEQRNGTISWGSKAGHEKLRF